MHAESCAPNTAYTLASVTAEATADFGSDCFWRLLLELTGSSSASRFLGKNDILERAES